MMRRLLGGTAELVHLLAIALVLCAAGTMAALREPGLAETHASLSEANAARVFEHVALLLDTWRTRLAALAFFGALLAPYLRADQRRVLAWMRMMACLALLLVAASMWPSVPVPEPVQEALASQEGTLVETLAEHARDGIPAWTAMLLLAGLDLVLAAFQIGGGARPPEAA